MTRKEIYSILLFYKKRNLLFFTRNKKNYSTLQGKKSKGKIFTLRYIEKNLLYSTRREIYSTLQGKKLTLQGKTFTLQVKEFTLQGKKTELFLFGTDHRECHRYFFLPIIKVILIRRSQMTGHIAGTDGKTFLLLKTSSSIHVTENDLAPIFEMKILKSVLNGAAGSESVLLCIDSQPCLEAKLCIFIFLSSSLNFRACPLAGGGWCIFFKLKMKFIYTFLKCLGGLVSPEDSCMHLSTEPVSLR